MAFEPVGSSLDWDWTSWNLWARKLIATHEDWQVAQTIADLGSQVNDLRKAMAAEARITEAQTLDVKSLGKGRRKILVTQVRRMYEVALAKQPPRRLARTRDWRAQVEERLRGLDPSHDETRRVEG